MLDVKSNNKGFLTPRLTYAEIESISSPATGLIVYNTDEDILLYYDGANWQKLNINCWPQPTTADAGSDQGFIDGTTSATLEANAPGIGHGSGQWSIISGTGGSFDDETDPNTLFTGVINQLYTLQWEITTNCGSSTDEVNIEFYEETQVVDITNTTTGQVWMDRNLGASLAATSSTDEQSYGYLYQWGRDTDGHQYRNSATTSTLSSSDTPGHGDFITVGSSPNDWRNPQNDNLWQGVSGTNNPCPSGYRLPTEAEWEAERQSWSSNDAAGAYASPLKLPAAGLRSNSNGSLYSVGSFGVYWSSTVVGSHSRHLLFGSSNASMSSDDRAIGYSVRCLKE
jgi:uncharacterized protein (TIGR02145 family)